MFRECTTCLHSVKSLFPGLFCAELFCKAQQILIILRETMWPILSPVETNKFRRVDAEAAGFCAVVVVDDDGEVAAA